MNTKTITITDVADLQAGDVTEFVLSGEAYTGRVREGNGGHLEFAGHIIRYADGRPGLLNGCFASATREVEAPELPNEPLSVITNVVTENGNKYEIAVLMGDGAWYGDDAARAYLLKFYSDDIVSFDLAKVVPADA